MALKCDQCGAPLRPKDDEKRTSCRYCGCVHDLKAPEPQSPDDEEPTVAPGRLIVTVVVVLIGVGAAGAMIHDCVGRVPLIGTPVLMALQVGQHENKRRQNSSGYVVVSRDGSKVWINTGPKHRSRRTPSRPRAERFGWTTHGTCVVDADGDPITDVASMTWGYKAGSRLTFVSGTDGRILWRGKHVRQNTPFYCINRHWVAVGLSGFRLRFHDVRRPGKSKTVRLRDKLSRFAMGQGCVRLKSEDGSVVGLALPSLKKTRCIPKRRRARPQSYPGLIQRHHRRGHVKQGKSVYQVSIRKRGTAMLTLRARQNVRRLWSKELHLAATRSGTALALHGNTLVVYGATTERSAKGVLLGLEPTTGKRRYERQLKNGGDSPSFFHYNGRWLLIAFGSGLYAHDPSTGKVRWKLEY